MLCKVTWSTFNVCGKYTFVMYIKGLVCRFKVCSLLTRYSSKVWDQLFQHGESVRYLGRPTLSWLLSCTSVILCRVGVSSWSMSVLANFSRHLLLTCWHHRELSVNAQTLRKAGSRRKRSSILDSQHFFMWQKKKQKKNCLWV